MTKSEPIKGYLLLLPILLLVGTFMFFPFMKGIYLSFFKTKYGFGDMAFCGFDNYIKVVQNEFFWTALRKSFLWVIITTILNMSVPMAIAIFMNREFRGKSASIAMCLIPWLTPIVGVALMSQWLLEPEVGVINGFMKNLGIINQGINFLGEVNMAFPINILLNFWVFCPLGILLTLSALSTIPKDSYEAMRIDGASSGQIITYLILPSIGKMIGFLGFFGFAYTFNSYGMTYLLTKGGPSHATYTVPIMVFEKTFQNINIGQATALSSMTGLFLFIVGVWFFKKVYHAV